MKRLLLILSLLPLMVQAQFLNPVHWTAEALGDSVRISASLDEGWHLTVLAINGVEQDEDLYETYSVVLHRDEAEIYYNACNDFRCISPTTYRYEDEDSVSTQADVTDVTDESHADYVSNVATDNYASIFLLGLLAGLLAIFTPCVWPIIPMTVSFFLKRTDNGVRSALAYGISIIVIYVGLGMLVTLLFGASTLNEWSTHAVVNIVFFVVLVLFALSFFGLFEITLPASWSSAMDSKARKAGGMLSILFMAFTLVIVSFSCTGPIIGTLLVEAAGHSLLAPMVGMLGFAIALAMPFSLFALFPRMLQHAPRSGGWMQDFKVTLAFLELALALKFLSVADLSYGWGILPRWLFVLIWALCFAGIGIYLIVRLVRTHRRTIGRIVVSTIVIVLSLGFCAYLIPGIFGAPVRLISAFAPPLPIAGQQVFHDYEEGMAYARQQQMPVLIDFTGYGCVNCRKMEAYVLADEHVQQRLKNYVFIELYVDDKRAGVGEKNSRIEAELIHANSQPYFVQLDSEGRIVSEPMDFTTDPDKFNNWLKY